MAINTVVRYRVRPDRIPVWESALGDIAKRAQEESEPIRYFCAQVQGGELGCYDIVLPGESVAEAASRDPAPALIARLFDSKEAMRIMADTSGSILGAESSILRDRPELAYPDDEGRSDLLAAVVTTAIVRPGHREPVEELFRKVAEAIPKTGESRRFTAWQPLIGDLRALYAVRPVRAWSELNEVGPLDDLLNQAFGAAEGGLIFRAAGEGLESLTSELVVLRPELSRLPD
ncbi:MAG: hypothetical protein JRE70_02955 [Deltaproteobacteria bacterium]|nr:hypothetical protein [Deltaproteobacteria bacterium]